MTTSEKTNRTKPFQPEAPQDYINQAIDEVMASLPDPALLSSEESRGLIGRYSGVLEGNFIYWMAATYLAVKSKEAKAGIEGNLLEEVRDNHPGMLRKFTVAAKAEPTEMDRRLVDRDLQNVRAFIGKMEPLKILLMMAFFEGWIQKFMAYLADMAARRGSKEMVYTDVHGVCDIEHTQGLFHAYAAELALAKNVPSSEELLEGVKLLRTLLQTIIRPA
jgi:hypothetical protein